MCRQILILLITSIASINAQTDRSIIIVGAGISGYSAARRLIENGYSDITILESLNRIGGRVYSVPFNNAKIDSGAQWVHGEVGNSIFQMVSPHFNFGSTPVHLNYPLFLLSNGTRPSQTNYQTLYNLGSSIIEEIYGSSQSSGSVGDLFVTKFDQAVTGPAYRHIDVATQNCIREEMRKEVISFFGASSWFDISARLAYENDFADGDQYITWRRDGYIKLFDFITKKLPNPAQYLNIDSKVQFNKRVTNISYNTNNPNGRSTVTCADGTRYTARHVIFTGSLGVLKKYHESLFTPALPSPKIDSIKNIAMGNLAKFFMEFDRPWWITLANPFVQFSFMWSEAHKNEARASNRPYLIDIAGISIVDQFPNVLQVFLSGSYTFEFEMASDEKITNDVMWMLELFMPNLRPIPRPIAVHKTKWLTHDSFLGAYSYPSKTQERNSATIENLASSIRATNGMPQVLFAGEATDTNFPSMAHGALDSGYRAANEILSFYR